MSSIVYRNKLQLPEEYRDLLSTSGKRKKPENSDPNFITDQKPKKTKTDIKATNDKLRNLSIETGGLEIDYEKEAKEVGADATKDVWDTRGDDIHKMSDEEMEVDADDLKSFIHLVKTKRKRKKRMGSMNLGEVDHLEEGEEAGHVKKLKLAREGKGGGGMDIGGF